MGKEQEVLIEQRTKEVDKAKNETDKAKNETNKAIKERDQAITTVSALNIVEAEQTKTINEQKIVQAEQDKKIKEQEDLLKERTDEADKAKNAEDKAKEDLVNFCDTNIAMMEGLRKRALQPRLEYPSTPIKRS